MMDFRQAQEAVFRARRACRPVLGKRYGQDKKRRCRVAKAMARAVCRVYGVQV